MAFVRFSRLVGEFELDVEGEEVKNLGKHRIHRSHVTLEHQSTALMRTVASLQ